MKAMSTEKKKKKKNPNNGQGGVGFQNPKSNSH